ncbi:hypothetical protein NEIMUCOT_05792 [Neisseria mucosa ATCC 25996]|uniref:Uncharacterized protein n=1 Tax=Neisseria mucosa (strain ATCC 25996 / DSM 4631 / NCTC 10774 / M26) TaxID=546266 RepID=D2ZYS7_NEIM2|nr:hypothetical protein NEIMUCOT_05792 [Neisseria mucosa ATCC 25996]
MVSVFRFQTTFLKQGRLKKMQRAIVAELYCFYKGFGRKAGAWCKSGGVGFAVIFAV